MHVQYITQRIIIYIAVSFLGFKKFLITKISNIHGLEMSKITFVSQMPESVLTW